MRKPSANREYPPPLEMECLKALWALGAGNVKAVQEWLAPERHLAYTTIMTLLERLVKRGAVTRQKSGRTFVYAATVDQEGIRRQAVGQLVSQLFGGSHEMLVAYLTNGTGVVDHREAATPQSPAGQDSIEPARRLVVEEPASPAETTIDTTLL